jgi:hypothetical protein
MLKRLLKQDWDAIAGIVAAIIALVLELLHLADTELILGITIVMIALLLIRDFKRESQSEKFETSLERIHSMVEDLKLAVATPDVTLVGPSELRAASIGFAEKGRGEVVWYNVCLRMYKAQQPFDIMLKPFIENPEVKIIRFMLDEGEKERWEQDVLPKIRATKGSKKVEEPMWCRLKDTISFVIAETGDGGNAEALVSFWGEPFMAIGTDKNVPRYVLYISAGSEMVARLREKERMCRVQFGSG